MKCSLEKFPQFPFVDYGTKSILFVLQMLVVGDKASFVNLSYKMKRVYHHSSVKNPTI